MNWRKLIGHSSLTTQQKHLILRGIVTELDIDDKNHRVSFTVKLKPEFCTKLAKSEFKVASIGVFKEGKERKSSWCNLIITIKIEEK